MIKFKGFNKDTKKEILGFGLSEANINKLKQGMPIFIDEPEFFKGEIFIMYGKTEKGIVIMLQKQVTPYTKLFRNKGVD